MSTLTHPAGERHPARRHRRAAPSPSGIKPRGRACAVRLSFAVIVALIAWRAPAAETASEPAIELPPMIVSDSVGHRPWRYVAGAGLEVLSRCDDETTRDLVERNDRLNQLLAYVIAPELQFHTTAPRLVLLVDSDMAPSMSQALVARFGAGSAGSPTATAAGAADSESAGRVRMLPNLQLADVDLVAVFAIVDRIAFDATHLTYAPEHVALLLGSRTPPLPAWYIAGFMRLYRDVRFGTSDIQISPFTWVSDADTRALANDLDAPRRLMPMREFFAFVPSAGDPRLDRWQSQAALFIRWALEPKAPERRAALSRFVARTAQEAASDDLARECLQLGFSDLRNCLSDYLPVAIKNGLRLEPPGLRRAPRLNVRNATAAEVARIKGEWERLEVHFVTTHHPQFVSHYVELARQTLATGMAAAPDDPGVLAARGLLESDLKDPKAARPYLEAAAAAGAVRPRVYVELAKFRLADALANDPQSPLSLGHAQVVLEPLQRALALDPPLAAEYHLTAEVWARSGAVLQPTQWAYLADGRARFPHDTGLLAYSAVLGSDRGQFGEAMQWIDRAIALSPPDRREPLLSVRRAILQESQRGPAK